MELSKVEQAILARFQERTYRAGGAQAGYGMRADAIRYVQARHPGLARDDVDRGLAALVEKGLLKPNATGSWYYLTPAGVERVATAS
jgi:hypothetical protein